MLVSGLVLLTMTGMAGWASDLAFPLSTSRDPLVSAASALGTGTITGTVEYTGTVTGTHLVWIGVLTSTEGFPPVATASRSGPGAYTIGDVAEGVYYISAYLDADDSGGNPNPAIDPIGSYAFNPITLTAGAVISAVNIVLMDPLSVPTNTGTIAGVVSYSGSVTGTHWVWVGAFTTTVGVPPVYSANIYGVGPYTLTAIAAGVYSIMGGMDADDSGGDPNPAIDPMGVFAGNPLTITAGAVITGVNFSLSDPAAPPTGTGGLISGWVTYTGRITASHQIIIAAGRWGEQGPPAYSAVIASPGPYTLTSVADYTYTLSAFIDLGDDMGPPQPDEPFGWYDLGGDGSPDLVIISGGASLASINIVLRDPQTYIYLPSLHR